MFLGCTLQGQELEHFIVWKTDETEHKAQTRTFQEQYTLWREMQHPRVKRQCSRGARSEPGSHLAPAWARLALLGGT